jgi:ATP-dependent DNA ligase
MFRSLARKLSLLATVVVQALLENDQALIFPARRLAANRLDAWQEVRERGYEGYVAKDSESPYRGGRTPLLAQGKAKTLSG